MTPVSSPPTLMSNSTSAKNHGEFSSLPFNDSDVLKRWGTWKCTWPLAVYEENGVETENAK